MPYPIRARSLLKSSVSFSLVLAAMAAPAFANPLGGTVTTGSASISTPSSKQTTISQKSEGAVIDWSSFNIGSAQTTTFNQPNAQALAVNRIGSGNASQIMGTLDANGRVVLINGNGIVFGRNSKVDVGSLVATSTDGSDSDLLAGKFTKAGSLSAAIINRGNITAASHGTVALVAPNVTNRGTINATLGTVSLGGANKFTVDFSGDGLVSFATQGDVNSRASVVNKGTLTGANVAMTAHAAEGIATGVVSTNGIIEAQGVNGAGGTITLDANNGTLRTRGTIDAGGTTGGGHVETSGDRVSIGGKIDAGTNGRWTVDPVNLTVDSTAATAIDNSLAADTTVTLKTRTTSASGPGNTSSGPGDIIIDAPITWSTGGKLNMVAYHSILFDAAMSITGNGKLEMTTNDGGTGGVLQFATGDDITFRKTTNLLMINGVTYTLVNSIAALADDVAADASGDYALSKSLNVRTTPYTASPVQTTLLGAFEGLGNTIANLAITDTTASDDVGLFTVNQGTIENLGLTTLSFSATGGSQFVGGLVGDNKGSLFNDYVTGGVSAKAASQTAGGLAGLNDSTGTIVDSYSTANVSGSTNGFFGGLVGVNGINSTAATGQSIEGSYASGHVNGGAGSYIGGLAGQSFGDIDDSYATGPVTQSGNGSVVGGLVGGFLAATGGIENSYATSNVSGVFVSIGGLVGTADTDPMATTSYAISNSYATGSVTAGSAPNGRVNYAGGLIAGGSIAVSDSYETGAVSAGNNAVVGGLIGQYAGNLSNSYATGSVTAGEASYVGGLIGYSYAYGGLTLTIQDSYAIGHLTPGAGDIAGGVVGQNGYGNTPEPGETYSNVYWDTTTTGASSGGSGATTTGLTTAQFQSGLPTGFSALIWGESNTINNGLPYLLALPPS